MSQRKRNNSDKCPKDGDSLCGYIFSKTLGEGAFGKVKLATKITKSATKITKSENIKYAVKFIDKSQMENFDDVERIYRESAILTSLKHDNIIRLYEVLDTEYHVLIVMEYANGGELKDFIQNKENGVLSELIGCNILNSILSGLEYCHRRKVIHRDLKLENILIDTSGNIKIADFGLSNTIQFGKKMNTSCGTPSYIAPEIIDPSICSNYKATGAECDIWSLGVILYSMISGFLPFQASNIKKLYDLIKTANYIFPDYISEESKDLIKAMLTVDIQKRINLAQIRNHSWISMRKNKNIPTKEQINDANQYCITRKKPIKIKTNQENNKIDDIQHILEQNISDNKTNVKHSKSLNIKLSPKQSLRSSRSRRKNAIDSIKNRLNKLKLSKTPRSHYNSQSLNNKSLSKSNNNNINKNNNNNNKKTKTPKNNNKSKSKSKINETLKTPNSKSNKEERNKKKTFHSPIIDSIMKRKPDYHISRSWNIESTYPELEFVRDSH